MSYRRAVAALASFCALAIVVGGCSSGGTGSQAGTAATSATSAAAGPAATSAATVMPASTSGSATSSRGGLTVSITGLPARAALTPGGPALEFTVNIKNGTSRTYRDITPVVAVEHCTCVNTTAQSAPAGILQEYSLATGKWRTVSYDRVGAGTDYLNVIEQAPLTLRPGATLSFTFRVRLRTAIHQPSAVRAGQAGLLVTVVRHSPGGSVAAAAKLASVRLGVPVEAG
jgi:hypothetical protein